MKYNKQIILFTPSFLANENDTIVVPPIYLLAKELKKQIDPSIKITVVSLHYPFTNKPYSVFNIDIHPIGAANCSYPKRLIYWFKAVRKIKALDQQLPIKMIHSFWLSECAFLVERFVLWRKIPHLISLMGQDALPSNNFLKHFKKPHYNLTTVCSFQTGQLAKTNGLSPMATINWGVEIPFQQIQYKNIDILSVGSFIPLKRNDQVIEIIKYLESKFNLVFNVVMVGSGPLINEVKASTKALKSEVLFLSNLSNEQVFDLMRKSKVLVHPSEYEAGPMVAVEALNNSCFVVSKPVGMFSDINSPNWIAFNSVTEMAEQVNLLLDKKEFTPGSLPNFRTIGGKFIKLYSQLSP